MSFEYVTMAPPRHLQRFVRYFWVFEGGCSGTPYVYRSMADPCAELLFQYRGTFDEFSADGRGTNERVCTAVDIAARVRVMSEFLSQLLLKEMVDTGRHQRVADLANHCNLSERQLERAFRRYSGFSPKKYMRILRFSAVCEQFSAGPRRTLTEIASDCGYYDQAHLIRDFTKFSGYRLSDYFSGTSEGIEWRDANPTGS